jgi:hypothetical protein
MGTARSAALRKALPFHPDVECARRVPHPTFGGAPRGRSSILQQASVDDSPLEESGFEPSVPSRGAQFWDLRSSSKPLCKLTRWSD